jgi:EAL domain-containing protein (putative c-di-GMP-specific phosphodiesterase class I)
MVCTSFMHDIGFMNFYRTMANAKFSCDIFIVMSIPLPYELVAEGVETEAQVALLAFYSCNMHKDTYIQNPLV